jgi:signal peptidase II
VKRSLLPLAAVAAAVIVLDRWTKHWASEALPFNQPVQLVGDYLRLTYTRNSGVAFGIGQGTGFPYYIFSVVAIIVIVWMFVRSRARQADAGPAGALRRFALSLILGGAAGNLVDRVTSGEVVDFIEVGIPQWHWPVFNVADSAVTVGVVLFALAWTRRREPAAAEGTDPDRSGGGTGALRDPEAGDEPPGPEGPGLERRGAAGPVPGGGAEEPLP